MVFLNTSSFTITKILQTFLMHFLLTLELFLDNEEYFKTSDEWLERIWEER